MSKCLLNSRRLDAVTTSLGNFSISNHPIDEEPFPNTQPDFPMTQLHSVPRKKISGSVPCEEDVYLPLLFSRLNKLSYFSCSSRIFDNFIQILIVCHCNILVFRTEHSTWSKAIPMQLYQSFSMACQNFPEVTSWYKFSSQYFPHTLLICLTVLHY